MGRASSIELGAFRLQERIGRGGMAEVWRGRHIETQTDIAVKVITTERAQDWWYVEHFQQEVQALARLNHPGIVSVFEHGLIDARAAEQSDGAFVEGSPFMVMEYAEGGTLDDQLPVQSWPELRHLLMSILDALAYAHARDVIHRDLKPENVLCFPQSDGRVRVKLADFGIAQAMRPKDDASAAETRASAGTPAYMAPEQARGYWRVFGPWTDLYALGCMVYALVCGSPPFTSESVLQLALDHMQATRPKLRPRFAVPDKLEWWIHNLMQPRSEDRMQRAAIAARALDEVAVSTFSGPFEAPSQAQIAEAADQDVDRDKTVVDPLQAADPLAETEPLSDDALQDTDDTTYQRVTTVLHETPGELPKAPESGGPVQRSVELSDIPEDWRRHWTPPTPEIAGVGLGLFGLREAPFVDRDAERELLWNEMRRARRHNQTRVVVLRGPAGAGKSKLSEWLAQRGHEIGVVDRMRASHDKLSGPADGLRGMLRRFFRAWNIGRKTLHQHLEQVLERHFPWADPDFEGVAEEDARALTELIKPAPADDQRVLGPRFQFSSQEDRFRVIQRVIDRAAARYTTICRLENVQWGEQTLEFVEFALEQASDTPVVYVLTVRSDELDRSFNAARRLDIITDHDATTVIDLEPLPEAEQLQLISSLLPLTPALEDTVVANSRNQPILAQQIIGSWIQEDLLMPGPLGFEGRPEAKLDIVADVHQIWVRRLREVLSHYDDERALNGLRALEVAAALGRVIDLDEWNMACGLLDIRVPEGLISDLVDAGLVEREESALSLVHELFQDSLQLSARESERWRAAKSACATGLEQLYPDRTRESAERRAEYHLAAEQPDRAAAALLEAADLAETRGFSDRTLDILDRRDALLDTMGVDADDKRRVDGDAARMLPLIQTGRFDETQVLADRVLDLSREHGWTELQAFGLRLQSGLLRAFGDREASLEVAQTGIDLLEGLGPNLNRGWLYIGCGEVHWSQNQYATARSFYTKAKVEFERAHDPYAALKAHSMIGFTHIYERNYDLARAFAEDTLDEARRLGDAWSEGEAWNQLGAIARLRGRLRDAHDNYTRLLKTLERRDPRNKLVSEFNLALTEMGLERESPRERLEWLRDTLAETGDTIFVPPVCWALVGVAASEQRWDAWERAFDDAVAQTGDKPGLIPDIAWAVTVAAELTRRHDGGDARIRRIEERAAEFQDLDGHGFDDAFFEALRGE